MNRPGRRRPAVGDIAAVGILICALTLTAVVVRRELAQGGRKEEARRIVQSPHLGLVGRAIGPKNAPATIVVFADFQCPYCARAQSVLNTLMEKYPGRLKILYRHLPLETLHPYAWTAALAVECAGDQERFREYHDLLYQLQDSLGVVPWSEVARRSKVGDLATFERCLKEEQHTNAIERDVLEARALELKGTPAFIVGNDLIEGIPPEDWFDRRITKALRK